MRNKILLILDRAATHDAIELKLREIERLFRKINPEEFIGLIDSSTGYDDPVYMVCWYHCSKTMRRAVNECALFTPERMKQLYPMWREFADESRKYIGARKDDV